MIATHVVLVRTPDGEREFEPRGPLDKPIARPREQAEWIVKQSTEIAKRQGWNLAYRAVPLAFPSVDRRCGACGASGFTYGEIALDGTRGYGCMTCGAVKPE
jgi:hypothetical protein